PRITALPREPQGEGIAYSPDGTAFLTIADQAGPVKILRYRPAVATAPPPKGPAALPPRTNKQNWFDRLSLRQITYLVAGVGVLGLVLVLVGILGIRRSRTERRLAALGTARGTASVAPAGDSWSAGEHDEAVAGLAGGRSNGYPDDYGDGVYG